MKPFKIHSDLYKQNYYFCPGFSKEEYERAFKRLAPESTADFGTGGGNTENTGDCIFIWIEGDKLSNLGQLAHECVHAANYTLQDRGVKHDNDNDEALAYLVEWLYDKCLKHMRVK